MSLQQSAVARLSLTEGSVPPPGAHSGVGPQSAADQSERIFFVWTRGQKLPPRFFFFLQLILSVRILPIKLLFFPTQFARFYSTNGVKKKEQVPETRDDYIYTNRQDAQVEALQNL